MQNVPECLQPALQEIEKFQTQISALEAKNSNLDEAVNVLHKQLEDDNLKHKKSVENLEAEKTSLRELNIVVSDQLKNKASLVNELQDNNEELNQKHSQVSSESQKLNENQEELNNKSEELNKELNKLKEENVSLREENSALTLVNSAMHQRNSDREGSAIDDNPRLLTEIENLKKELETYKNNDNDSGDSSFLKSEVERLTQRHSDIIQEKMQASAQMHSAKDELSVVQSKLDEALQKVKQLDFELSGLRKLHLNLTQEKNDLLENSKIVAGQKDNADEKNTSLEDDLQRVETEKSIVTQELNAEQLKSDKLTQVINQLRIKNSKLEAESSQESSFNPLESTMPDRATIATEPVKEPDVEELDVIIDDYEGNVEVSSSSHNSGPSFPGEPR